MAREVMFLMRANLCTRSIGMGGPENQDFFGP
jgi:hypothetical protein